jgi:hypothetical protein
MSVRFAWDILTVYYLKLFTSKIFWLHNVAEITFVTFVANNMKEFISITRNYSLDAIFAVNRVQYLGMLINQKK